MAIYVNRSALQEEVNRAFAEKFGAFLLEQLQALESQTNVPLAYLMQLTCDCAAEWLLAAGLSEVRLKVVLDPACQPNEGKETSKWNLSS